MSVRTFDAFSLRDSAVGEYRTKRVILEIYDHSPKPDPDDPTRSRREDGIAGVHATVAAFRGHLLSLDPS